VHEVAVIRAGPAGLGVPGLHFIGFSKPISGNLRQIALDARWIAKALRATRLTAPPRAASFRHGADPDGA